MKPNIPTITLPFWLGGNQIAKLLAAATSYWQRVRDWLWFAMEIDELTAPIEIVDLLAWERRVQRFDTETEALYRLRVKFAFANEQDAGQTAGLIRIYERLGINGVTIEEFVPGWPWDVVKLNFDGQQITDSNALIMILARQYGRTCRRYVFADDSEPVTMHTQGAHWGNTTSYSVAGIE